MSKEKTYDNCEWFGERNCPNKKEEIMKQFIYDASFIVGVNKKINLDNTPTINKKYCNPCASFKLKELHK